MNRPLVKKEQLDFLDWEFGAFFHFGIRTFYEGHVDWDMKEMPLEGFNPTELDCENWIDAIARAGMKYAVLVCKHHDGFANWPSAYTDYSVKNTPWKNGEGDVVREFTEACRRHDIKVGFYYSPAQFGSAKMDAAEYDNYFINQISELLTNYGKIDYLWFDGCGSDGHTYDFPRIVSEIRRMQPEILIFNMGDPDTCWCGNEDGYCVTPNFNFREYEGETRFLPYECDCRIRRSWFYFDADKGTQKSLNQLMGMYLNSVGKGANMLLNIAPDRRGLLPEEDIEAVIAFGDEIKRRFGSPLAAVANPTLQNNKITVSFDRGQEVNAVVLTENPASETPITGVKVYAGVYYVNDRVPVQMATAQTVGHKAIITFPAIITQEITVEIECGGTPELTSVSVC